MFQFNSVKDSRVLTKKDVSAPLQQQNAHFQQQQLPCSEITAAGTYIYFAGTDRLSCTNIIAAAHFSTSL